MLEHRPGRYTPTQMRHCLAWLARLLRDRSQSEFHLDRLQPDCLPTKTQQRLVVLASVLSGWLVFGLAFGLGGELVSELVSELGVELAEERSTPNEGIHRSALHGLVFGLIGGLYFGGEACLRHLALRGLLAYNGVAPLRYVRFLDEATERLFLRRAGSGYLFVHRMLLEYLTGLETAPLPGRAVQPVAR